MLVRLFVPKFNGDDENEKNI